LFCASAPFLSGSAAILTALVAVAGLFLPERQSAQGPQAPAPPMIGDIVDIQLASQHPCCTFSVQVRLSGFNGQHCLLRATLINAADGSETRSDERIFIPEADAYQARADVSVSAIAAGTYIPRFILYDSNKFELDRSETTRFRVILYDHDTRHAWPGERLSGRNPTTSREHLRPDQPRQRIRRGAVHRRFLPRPRIHQLRRDLQLPDRAEPNPSW